MIDEPTTEERLAALLARHSGRADGGAPGPKAKGHVTPMRPRRTTPDEMPPPPVGRGPQPTAGTPFERSFDRWPGSWDDAPRPPALAGTPADGPTGGVFDFDTPGWPAPGEDHRPGLTRTGPARRLLADDTIPLATVPPTSMPNDATLGDRVRGGAERWVRSWSTSRLVASGTTAVSFVAMVVAMGPLLQPDEETATEAGTGTGTGEIDPALTSGVEAPAVSISVDPLVGAPGTPPDATGQPVPLSGTAPDGARPGTASSTVATGPVAGSSMAVTAAPAASTTQPAANAPATSAVAGTAPATAAPSTQPPATAAPTTAKPGSTAAPTTQPPATAAPTTQPPTTATPTTAKPTTTAPPTTKAS